MCYINRGSKSPKQVGCQDTVTVCTGVYRPYQSVSMHTNSTILTVLVVQTVFFLIPFDVFSFDPCHQYWHQIDNIPF